MQTSQHQHTPGPWAWDGYSLRSKHPDPDTQAVHTIIDAEHIGWGFVGSDPAATRAESAANLALIAAAPDLLEALHLALPFVEDHEGDQSYKTGVVAKAVAKIKGAIAHATGDKS